MPKFSLCLVFSRYAGLAGCVKLREVYLSDNKISEAEGLHRLLKLTLLDLARNKLSSTKSLGQLAANYGTLQALNLAGNPVHINLSEDAFRKFILGEFLVRNEKCSRV